MKEDYLSKQQSMNAMKQALLNLHEMLDSYESILANYKYKLQGLIQDKIETPSCPQPCENENQCLLERDQPILYKKQAVDLYLTSRNATHVASQYGISVATLRRWVQQVKCKQIKKIRKFLPKNKKKVAEEYLKRLLVEHDSRTDACKKVANYYGIELQTVYKWSYKFKPKDYEQEDRALKENHQECNQYFAPKSQDIELSPNAIN